MTLSENPTIIGFIPGIGGVMDVVTIGTTTFLASETFGLSKVNVVNPNDPELISSSNIPFYGTNISVNGNIAVVTGKYKPTNTAHLKVIDVTAETTPMVIGELPTTISAFYDVVLNSTGNLAVAAAGTSGVWVIDITNPSTPFVLSIYDTPGTAYGVALSSTGSLVYVADGSGGLSILSLSNPSVPTLVGILSMSGKIFKDVALSGSFAYIVNQQGTLDKVNVSNPAAPQWMGLMQLLGFGSHIAIEETKAVVISGTSSNDTLEIVDISNISPVRIGSVSIGAVGTGKGIALSNGVVYVAANSEGLKIYDISSPTNPVLHDQVTTTGDAIDITIKGLYAYVADFPATINIIIVSIPTCPTPIVSFNLNTT